MVQDVMRVWGESTSNPLKRLQVLGIVLIHAEEMSCGASCLTWAALPASVPFPAAQLWDSNAPRSTLHAPPRAASFNRYVLFDVFWIISCMRAKQVLIYISLLIWFICGWYRNTCRDQRVYILVYMLLCLQNMQFHCFYGASYNGTMF